IVQQADRLSERAEFEAALAAYERALETGGLSRELLIRAYAGVGLASAVMLQPERAVWAFTRVLALDEVWLLPKGLGPKVREPFVEARAFWANQQRPQLDVSAAGSTVTVSAQGTLLDLVSALRLRWRSGERAGELSASGTRGVFRIPAAVSTVE